MAKRRGDATTAFAEDLGRLLGQAENKAKSWLSQRESVVMELTRIRDAASKYLGDLAVGGAELAAAVGRGRATGKRRGRPPGSGKKRGPGRPKGSGKKKGGMSAAGRRAIAAAQKKRWAKIRKEKKAKGGKKTDSGGSSVGNG
jgi:hypothetical protein